VSSDWQPGAANSLLQARAALYDSVRGFFRLRQVLEVTTPLLGRRTVTALHLDSLKTTGVEGERLYLQTSPEYFMKRLLAAGSGPIYSMAPSFREGEVGRLHNPEFMMLEWYQPGYSLSELMIEVGELVLSCTDQLLPVQTTSYEALFMQTCQLNPHSAETGELLELAAGAMDMSPQQLQGGSDTSTRNNCLDQLFNKLIQPELKGLQLVYDYPATQAALARTSQNSAGHIVAQRFEAYLEGIELANGYDESGDHVELKRRFEEDNRERLAEGKGQIPLDEKLLAAIESGLPSCCGVALGIDRLLLCLSGAESLDQVQTFSFPRL